MRGVTLKEAGSILGGDVPISIRTISRLIKRGDLDAYGAGSCRRVTMTSIDASIEREVARNKPSLAALQDLDLRPRSRRGRRPAYDLLEDSTLEVISIPARLPKIGLIDKQGRPLNPRRGKRSKE